MTPIYATHAAITVGTGSTAAAVANPGRRLLILQNISNEAIDVNVAGGTAAASTGLRLAAAGTTGDRMQWERSVPVSAITAICASGSKTLLVTEGT